jgi:hypothetical protein
MAIELNRPAVKHARALVREGKVTRDESDAWSEVAPTAAQENRFIDDHGWTEFSHWHLGIHKDEKRTRRPRVRTPFRSATSRACTARAWSRARAARASSTTTRSGTS